MNVVQPSEVFGLLDQIKELQDLGMDRSHICDLERGRKTVSLSTMELFANGLHVDLIELLRGV